MSSKHSNKDESSDNLSIENLRALLYSYAQSQLYDRLRAVVSSQHGLYGTKVSTEIKFWSAFATLAQGRYEDSVHDLEKVMRDSQKSYLPVLTALLYAHSRCELTDNQAVTSLTRAVVKAEKRADEDSLLTTAQFFMLLSPPQYDDALKMVKSALKIDGKSLRALCTRGWIQLLQSESLTSSSEKKEMLQSAARSFQPALKAKTLDSLLGLTRYFQIRNQLPKALEAINQVIVRHGWFSPALLTKARLLLSMSEWTEAKTTCERCLEEDAENVEALRILTLVQLVREGNMEDSEEVLERLNKSLARTERTNASLYHNTSLSFSRLVGGKKRLLALTLGLAERAADIEPKNSAYLSECAFQHVLSGDVEEGMRLYKRASKLNESNVQAFLGTIQCLLLQGKTQEAHEQLEFFAVVSETIGNSPELTYLHAKLAWLKDGDKTKQRKILCDQVLPMHWKRLENLDAAPNSFRWYLEFNCEFLLQIARDLLEHCPEEPLSTSDSPSPHLIAAKSLLTRVTRAIPACVAGKIELARCHFLMGTDEGYRMADSLLTDALRLDPTQSSSFLMMARIGLERDDVEAAEKALDEALAKDFEVRKNPYYFFIQSFVLESKDRVEDAKDALKKALQVPRFESVRNAKKKKKKKKKSGKISKVVDGANLMVKIYERLAKLHHTLKQIGDAESTIREALEIFEGTAQETELRIVESRQAMERGDAHKALKLLALLIQSSDVSEETWIQATQVKADIYLKHRKHKKGFIKCYQRISQRLRNKRGYVLLGDAYMRIHDPTKAIESYERALREQPGDVALTVLIGNTMMTTHNYQAAVEYFESALDSHGQDKTALRLALAELLTRLKRWSEAQAILSDAIRDKKRRNNNNTEETTASWIEDVHILRILTNVYFGNGDDTQALETIQKANSIQDKILSRLGQNSNAAIAQKKIAAEIRCVIGKHIASFDGSSGDKKQNAQACEYFTSALELDTSSEIALISLARLYILDKKAEDCEKMCRTLLRINPTHRQASVILADALSMKNDATQDVFHFTQLLKSKPDNFVLLARVISLLWRSGKLDSAKRLLDRAKHVSHEASHSAGYHFCQGLYYRFATEPNKAIKYLNLARRDGEWGRRAIEMMVRVYISPGGIGTYLWDQQSFENNRGEAQEAQDVIESLMREPPMLPHTKHDEILLCYGKLMTRQKDDIDYVLRKCLKIIEQERQFVPALLCMSVALKMINQVGKARNQLKRICKIPYRRIYGREFEEAYLMLANIYMGTKKYDLALELCKRCLKYNKSCSTAWEHRGRIMEEEHSYKDAAEFYEKAWFYGQEASSTVGYKLAFNYLKAHRYIDAIDVCHKVLKKNPNFPKIQEEILDRARQSLRA